MGYYLDFKKKSNILTIAKRNTPFCKDACAIACLSFFARIQLKEEFSMKQYRDKCNLIGISLKREIVRIQSNMEAGMFSENT